MILNSSRFSHLEFLANLHDDNFVRSVGNSYEGVQDCRQICISVIDEAVPHYSALLGSFKKIRYDTYVVRPVSTIPVI